LFEKAETEFFINLLGGLYEAITKGEMAVRYRIRSIVLFYSLRKKKTILAYLALILYTEINAKTMPTALQAVKAMQENPIVYIFCTSIGDSDSEIQSAKSPE